MKTITWTRLKLSLLKAAYKEAVKRGAPDFYLGNDQFVTAYAKYLIEYLDLQFKPDTREIIT
jgi:hypothetical protein